MSDEYRLPDEPKASGLSRWAVQPFWPLLGLMIGGAWLAWPWFALNGFAMGSPTRRRELVLVVVGLLMTPLPIAAAGLLLVAGWDQTWVIQIMGLVVILWKLAIAYWLYALQSRTFEIYRYYGGGVANGGIALVLGLVADRAVDAQLRQLGAVARMVLG